MSERGQLIPPSQQQTISERRIFKIDDRGLKGLDPYKASMDSGNSLLRMSNPSVGNRGSSNPLDFKSGTNLSTMVPPQSNILPNQRPPAQTFQNAQNPFGNINSLNNQQSQQTGGPGFLNQGGLPQGTNAFPMQNIQQNNNFQQTPFKTQSQPALGGGSGFLSQNSQQGNTTTGTRPPGFVASGWPQSQPQPQTQLKPQIQFQNQNQNQNQMNLLPQPQQQMVGSFNNSLQVR